MKSRWHHWLAYHVYMRVPLRWNLTRPALWLLGHGSVYAYCELWCEASRAAIGRED